MNNINDMTEGNPLHLMVRFSVPILLANILQLFYVIADSAVAGRILGVTAFASIGATATLHWFVLSIVNGFVNGFGVVFAQYFGAKDINGFRKVFISAVYLMIIISITIGCAGVLGSGFLLMMLNTPPELLNGAVIYLSWLLGGICITFAYNLLGAILRALGDSKTPLKGMILASLLNIVLDIILVRPLGILGIAIATLSAQFTACGYCFIALCKTGLLQGSIFKWDITSARILLRIGLPLGLRNGIIEVGGLLVQRYINNYGMEFIAGIAAAKRMYSLLIIPGSAFEAANGIFTAQNYGSKRFDRVKQGINSGRWLMLVSVAVIMIVLLPFRYFILGLLFDGEPVQINAVLEIGVKQLTLLMLGLPLLYLLLLYRSTLEGMGKPFIPMLSGFIELFFRILSVFLLTPIIGEIGILVSIPIGWTVAAGLLIITYYVVCKKLIVVNN